MIQKTAHKEYDCAWYGIPRSSWPTEKNTVFIARHSISHSGERRWAVSIWTTQYIEGKKIEEKLERLGVFWSLDDARIFAMAKQAILNAMR